MNPLCFYLVCVTGGECCLEARRRAARVVRQLFGPPEERRLCLRLPVPCQAGVCARRAALRQEVGVGATDGEPERKLRMTEFWVCFSCCIAEQPQPKRRRRIDRSMIGEPTNFVHTTHVGSGDMGLGLASVDLVQAQMKSKGGYVHGASEGSQL